MTKRSLQRRLQGEAHPRNSEYRQGMSGSKYHIRSRELNTPPGVTHCLACNIRGQNGACSAHTVAKEQVSAEGLAGGCSMGAAPAGCSAAQLHFPLCGLLLFKNEKGLSRWGQRALLGAGAQAPRKQAVQLRAGVLSRSGSLVTVKHRIVPQRHAVRLQQVRHAGCPVLHLRQPHFMVYYTRVSMLKQRGRW